MNNKVKSTVDKLTAVLRICVEPNCANISNNASKSLVLVSANQQSLHKITLYVITKNLWICVILYQ